MSGGKSGLRYLLAGGGTSGHVNPALAIADQIKKEDPEADIRFCGTARGIEHEIVPRAGYPFIVIRARGLPRRLSLELFRALADFLAGRRQCRRFIRSFRPDVVIGTGGYVCSPVVAAAASLHVPILLHEQNAFPGRSNRLMAKRSQIVCISFPGTEHWFSTGTPIVLTGNPVRSIFFQLEREEARRRLQIDPAQPVVLAMGGSLGAQSINQAVLGLDPWLRDPAAWPAGRPHIYLAAGQRQYESVSAAAADFSWLTVSAYFHDIHLVMAAADLLICRSGAITCSELAALGRPAVLAPYPYAAGDHQTYNARVFADAGAAVLCPDQQLSADWLADRLRSLLADPDRLADMGRAAKTLARPDAAASICACLRRVIP